MFTLMYVYAQLYENTISCRRNTEFSFRIYVHTIKLGSCGSINYIYSKLQVPFGCAGTIQGSEQSIVVFILEQKTNKYQHKDELC